MKGGLCYGKRTALVTGGSKNIGFSITEKLLSVGLNVAIVSSNAQNIQNALSKLKGAGRLRGYVCDLTNLDKIPETLNCIFSDFGSLDIIVNCAGLLDMSSIEETTEKCWDQVFDINLKAPFFLVQNALPFLKRADHPRIINISSNSGRMGGFANGLSYSASKGGMIALTYGMARHLAPWGITVNCIAPGTIESDMLKARDEKTLSKLLERFPLNRFGRIEEVAAAVLYFACLESDFTTGSVLDVNGGLFMG